MMAKLLLSVHVLTAIIFVGPVAVAVILFPRYARLALAARRDAARLRPTVGLLHRVTRVGSVHALSVPVFGLATASVLGVLGDGWVQGSIVLTLCAAGVMAVFVIPSQHVAMVAIRKRADGEEPARPCSEHSRGVVSDQLWAWTARLTVATGSFTVIWAVIVILMIVRPGSTTGV
ncbi:MAG: hypothetical protein ACRDRG_13020 [Pseudonocardiaceae bacterium]